MGLLDMQVDAAPAWYDYRDAIDSIVITTQAFVWLKVVWILGAISITWICIYSVAKEIRHK